MEARIDCRSPVGISMPLLESYFVSSLSVVVAAGQPGMLNNGGGQP
jgi:hypothetical protein